MTTVVSGFNGPGFTEYGESFLCTFDRYWPKDVALVVYVEEPIPPRRRYRAEERSLWTIPGIKEFIDKHQDAKFRGLEPVPGWRKKEILGGYSYRYDVVRFCRQLFIPEHAAASLPDGHVLAWLDADVISFAEVPEGLIERLLGNHDLVSLGRDGESTEIGFWAVRLSPITRKLLKEIADSYRTGKVFQLYEWHSGYVWDFWVDRYKVDGVLNHKSLTKGHGHIWHTCELGKYLDHLKGETRKKLGYSPERFGETVKQRRERLVGEGK